MFLRLTLKDKDGTVLGSNFYWHNRKNYQDYRALKTIPDTTLDICILETFQKKENGGGNMTVFRIQVKNGDAPALGVRLRLLNTENTEMLPVFYSDNYLLMMPGETRIITAEVSTRKLRGEGMIEGSAWNLAPVKS